jgi:hypothetical protein
MERSRKPLRGSERVSASTVFDAFTPRASIVMTFCNAAESASSGDDDDGMSVDGR